MDNFRLEAVEKRFHMRFVCALPGPIHAGLNSAPAQLILAQIRLVLDASVRVQDQPRPGRPHS